VAGGQREHSLGRLREETVASGGRLAGLALGGGGGGGGSAVARRCWWLVEWQGTPLPGPNRFECTSGTTVGAVAHLRRGASLVWVSAHLVLGVPHHEAVQHEPGHNTGTRATKTMGSVLCLQWEFQ
jgi:hypothetical protein